MGRVFLILGAFLMLVAVAAGAYAAHGLSRHVDAEMVRNFETGVRYHTYHALALLIVGNVIEARRLWLARIAAGFFIAGILLFSGNLYIYALSGETAWARLVPVGGVAFMAGWFLLALAFFAVPRQRRPEAG